MNKENKTSQGSIVIGASRLPYLGRGASVAALIGLIGVLGPLFLPEVVPDTGERWPFFMFLLVAGSFLMAICSALRRFPWSCRGLRKNVDPDSASFGIQLARNWNGTAKKYFRAVSTDPPGLMLLPAIARVTGDEGALYVRFRLPDEFIEEGTEDYLGEAAKRLKQDLNLHAASVLKDKEKTIKIILRDATQNERGVVAQ